MSENKPLSFEDLEDKADPPKARPSRSPSPTPSPPPKLGKDKLGSYIRSHPHPILDLNRTVWSNRAMLFLLSCSIALNFGFFALFTALLPLKETKPYFIMLQNANELLVNTQPIPLSNGIEVYIVENVVREYVTQRNKIYPLSAEMVIRWLTPESFIATYSSKPVYDAFQKHIREVFWPDFTRKKFYQNITINRVRNLGISQWDVEFSTVEMQLGSSEETNLRYWLAEVTIEQSGVRDFAQARKAPRSDLANNPFGIRIIHYQQNETKH